MDQLSSQTGDNRNGESLPCVISCNCNEKVAKVNGDKIAFVAKVTGRD
jgi:hypothetical protein